MLAKYRLAPESLHRHFTLGSRETCSDYYERCYSIVCKKRLNLLLGPPEGCYTSTAFTLDDGMAFESVLVHGIKQKRSVVVGVAALIPANGNLRTANPRILHAISDALLEKGDVVSSYAAQ